MPLRFSFRQLEYLVAVGEAGTIAMAAQRVNVSSPSISSAISQLETDLGLQLFVRHHAQGLSLTPGGRRVFIAAKQILSAYPDASVSLKDGSQTHLLRMLSQAEIDVAITYDLDIPKDIQFEPVATLPPYVMLAKDHPKAAQPALNLAELKDEAMILLDLPLSRDYFLSLFHDCGLRPNIAARTSDMSMVRSLVANGFGFGLVNLRSRSDLAPDGETLVTRPLAGPVRPVVLGLATKGSDHRSGIVTAFFRHAKDQLGRGEHLMPDDQP